MANSLYISTTESGSGKILIALGIIDFALRKIPKVGFFRPIIQASEQGEKDEDINLILTYFQLEQSYQESFGLDYKTLKALLEDQKYDEILERIITKYKYLEQKCDFILCEGSDYLGESSAFEFNLNTEIAKNLGCPILILGNAENRSIEDAITPVEISSDTYRDLDCKTLGIILNKANWQQILPLKTALAEKYQNEDYFLAVIPYEKKLISPRVRNIGEQLKAEVLYGQQRLDTLVSNYVVAAMQVQHALTWLKEDSLVITPGDRGDILIGVMQAHQSTNYPSLAGIVLTGGFRPESAITKLIEGLPNPLPILLVETDTYITTSKIKDIHTNITPTDREKIALSIQMFDENIDLERLEHQLRTVIVQGITPKMFTYNLVQQAKSNKQHIVLPEGNDPRILKAVAVLLSRQIVDITLLGNKEEIYQIVKQHGIILDLNNINIINPATSSNLDMYVQKFYELRKHKGVTLDAARDYLIDPSYFGTMMVYLEQADGMVSGAVHTTQHTIRPALQFVKTKPGCSIVSSVFFMCLKDRVLVYGDCAVNPDPTSEQLADIAISSAETAKSFGIEPKVALLSYSSGSSGQGNDVEKVRKATQIAKEKRPDFPLEGPIQYDAAVDQKVAAQKMPGSQVAGKATVFVFPDLNTGNNTYKAVQRETGALAIGPVLQGLRKPVNDLSRGCTVDDIINTVVITAIQAQNIT
jgi:phosphate acetyltransferase